MTPQQELGERLSKLEDRLSLNHRAPPQSPPPLVTPQAAATSFRESSDHTQLSLLLEEKSLELEQRNVLLRRAEHTICHLRSEANALRGVVAEELPFLRASLTHTTEQRDELEQQAQAQWKELLSERLAHTQAEESSTLCGKQLEEANAQLLQVTESNDALARELKATKQEAERLIVALGNEQDRANQLQLVAEEGGEFVQRMKEQTGLIEQRLHSLETERDELRAQKSEVEAEVINVRSQHDAQGKELELAMEQQEALVHTVHELKSQLVEARTLSDQLSMQRDAAVEQSERDAASALRSATELGSHRHAVRTMQDELSEYRQHLEKADEDNAQLVAERNLAREDVHRAEEAARTSAAREAEERSETAVKEAEEKSETAVREAEERCQRKCQTRADEAAQARAQASLLSGLCTQYARLLPLALGQVEEACIVTIGISGSRGGGGGGEAEQQQQQVEQQQDSSSCSWSKLHLQLGGGLLADGADYSTEYGPDYDRGIHGGIHSGGDASAPAAAAASFACCAQESSLALERANRTTERIMRRLASCSAVRKEFTQAVAQAEARAKDAMAEAHRRVERALEQLNNSERRLSAIKEQAEFGERRAALGEREACFHKLDAAERERRLLRDRLANAEAEVALLHSHIKHVKQGQSDEAQESAAGVRSLFERLSRRDADLEELKGHLDSMTQRNATLVAKLEEVNDDLARAVGQRDELREETVRLGAALLEAEGVAKEGKAALDEVTAQRDAALAMEGVVKRELRATQAVLRAGGMDEEDQGDGGAGKEREEGEAGGGGGGGGGSGGGGDGESSLLQSQVEALHELCTDLAGLVYSTSSFYEMYQDLHRPSPGGVSGGAGGGGDAAGRHTPERRRGALETECLKLLECNAYLALRVQHLGLDYQRLARGLVSASEDMGVGVGAGVGVSHYGHGDGLPQRMTPTRSPSSPDIYQRQQQQQQQRRQTPHTQPLFSRRRHYATSTATTPGAVSQREALSPSAVYGRAVLTPNRVGGGGRAGHRGYPVRT